MIVPRVTIRTCVAASGPAGSLESEKTAAGHNHGFNFLILIPAVHTAVGVENVGKQLIHQNSTSQAL